MRLSRLLSAACLSLVACAALPPAEAPLDRVAPESAAIERPAGLPAGAWPDARWWQRWHDPQLGALIERALADAPEMATAQARVRVAERSAELARAQTGPSLDLDASLTREKLPRYGLIPPPYGGMTIWDAEAKLGFAYDFDFWGRNRSALQAALDEARAARAERDAAALMLSSAVAQQYFHWQLLQQRMDIAQRERAQRERLVRLLTVRLEHDMESRAAVDQAIADREQQDVAIAALAADQRLVRQQIVALLGAAPGSVPALSPVALPQEETGVPERLGLDLIARRPDVEASRLRVEAAFGHREAARARFYPDIKISAFAGLSSVVLDKFLDPHSLSAGAAPALHLPIFDAGRLRAGLRVSRAQLDLAIAQYNQAVLGAASDVATAADTLAGIAGQRVALERAIAASATVVANAQRRESQGLTDARETARAELPHLQRLDQLAQLDGQRIDAQIALIKALGGGYTSAPANADAAAAGAD